MFNTHEEFEKMMEEKWEKIKCEFAFERGTFERDTNDNTSINLIEESIIRTTEIQNMISDKTAMDWMLQF